METVLYNKGDNEEDKRIHKEVITKYKQLKVEQLMYESKGIKQGANLDVSTIYLLNKPIINFINDYSNDDATLFDIISNYLVTKIFKGYNIVSKITLIDPVSASQEASSSEASSPQQEVSQEGGGGRRVKRDEYVKTSKHYKSKCIYVKGRGKTESVRHNKKYMSVKEYERKCKKKN